MAESRNAKGTERETKRKRAPRPKTKASAKFAKGPAAATFAWPYFWSLKLKGFIGTGFAQPKTMWLPGIIIKSSGKSTEPIGSKCFKGLRLNLPDNFAVGSPR